MRARYYNVEINRFVNQDVLLGVLERISSLNRYAYVEGNPVSYLDPFGLAIQVLQNVLDAASIIVSLLSIVAFLLPGIGTSFFVSFNIFYMCTNALLNTIQFCRYQSEDRLNEIITDFLVDSLFTLLPVFSATGWKFISKFEDLLGSKGSTFIKAALDIKKYISDVY